MKGEKLRKGIESLRDYVFSKENRKNIVMVILLVVLITAADIVRSRLSGPGYIVTDEGSLVGVIRPDTKEYSEFPLKVEIKKGKDKSEKDVDLVFDKADDEKEDAAVKSDKKAELSAKIDEVVDALSKSDDKKVMLPLTLSDGSKLSWEERSVPLDPILILLAPVLILTMFFDSVRKKREREKERKSETITSLPGFCDHIVMMLGSGLTLSDAFSRVAEAYRKRKKKNYFEERMIEADDERKSGTSDLVNVLVHTSDEINVRDFSRIADLMKRSQTKGTELSSHLKEEGRILWDLRKKEAEERGKLAETKLTAPLAVLLLVLILITAAPAIIQVKGG